MRSGPYGLLVALLVTVAQAPTATAAEPPVVLTDPRIVESSALAASVQHPGVVWTLNDSGGGNRLFAVEVATGQTVATLTVRDALNADWEALAMGRGADGGPTLVVGELGTSLPFEGDPVLYEVPEPAALTDAAVVARARVLRYPGAQRPDAETLLVDPRDGATYVVSKVRDGGTVFRVGSAPGPDGVWPLEAVGPAPARIGDGTFLPDGRVVLRTTRRAYLLDALGAQPVDQFDLPRVEIGESVAVLPDGATLVAGEEGEQSRLWRIPLPDGWRSTVPSVAPAVVPTPPSARVSPLPEDAAVEAAPSPARAGPSRVVVPAVAGAAGVVVAAVLVAGVLLRRRRPRARRANVTPPTAGDP